MLARLTTALIAAGFLTVGCADAPIDDLPGKGEGSEVLAPEGADEIEEKIVGGQRETGYPAVAMLQTNRGGLCTGTLIAPDWVLTAAHCLGGMSRATFETANGVVTASVAQEVGHPQYNDRQLTNDIALLRLSAPVSGVEPMAIASQRNNLAGQSAFFVGYGNDNGRWGTGAGTKRSVSIDVVEDDNGGIFYYQSAGRNTCNGDSGGPAFVDGELVGVTSFGDQYCEQYGADTDVAEYYQWIVSHTGALGGGIDNPGGDNGGDNGGDAGGDAGGDNGGDNGGDVGGGNGNCGDLTYEGKCEGLVAKWCDNGEVKQRNCWGAGGQTCDFLGNNIGFYCRDRQTECDLNWPTGDAYDGVCAGDTALWCSRGRLRSADCGRYNMGCGETQSYGFYCTE